MEATKNYFLTEINLIGEYSQSYYETLMWEYNHIDWDSHNSIRAFENYMVAVRMHVKQSY